MWRWPRMAILQREAGLWREVKNVLNSNIAHQCSGRDSLFQEFDTEYCQGRGLYRNYNIQQNSPIYKPVSICKLQACQLCRPPKNTLSQPLQHIMWPISTLTEAELQRHAIRDSLPLPLLYPPETIIRVSFFVFDESLYSSTVPRSVGVISKMINIGNIITVRWLQPCLYSQTSANYFLFQP